MNAEYAGLDKYRLCRAFAWAPPSEPEPSNTLDSAVHYFAKAHCAECFLGRNSVALNRFTHCLPFLARFLLEIVTRFDCSRRSAAPFLPSQRFRTIARMISDTTRLFTCPIIAMAHTSVNRVMDSAALYLGLDTHYRSGVYWQVPYMPQRSAFPQ